MNTGQDSPAMTRSFFFWILTIDTHIQISPTRATDGISLVSWKCFGFAVAGLYALARDIYMYTCINNECYDNLFQYWGNTILKQFNITQPKDMFITRWCLERLSLLNACIHLPIKTANLSIKLDKTFPLDYCVKYDHQSKRSTRGWGFE